MMSADADWDQWGLPTAMEVVAQAIYETWGGPWEAAPLGRKMQARKEASDVFTALVGNHDAKAELINYLSEGAK